MGRASPASPVQHEDGPEDRHIKHGQEGGCEAQQHRLQAAPPAAADTAAGSTPPCVLVPISSALWDTRLADRIKVRCGASRCFAVLLLPPAAHQNLNSGRRRTKGRNSSSDLLGSVGPSSSGLTWGLHMCGGRVQAYRHANRSAGRQAGCQCEVVSRGGELVHNTSINWMFCGPRKFRKSHLRKPSSRLRM